MSDYLLDTNAIIHFVSSSPRVSAAVRNQISNPDNKIFVSVVSHAEVACAVQRKRITLPAEWKFWMKGVLETNGWNSLAITLAVIEEAYSLPEPFHQDPADRILVATCRIMGLTLITSDTKILAYPHVSSLPSS